MPKRRKVFRIEAFVRTTPMREPAQHDSPRLLQSVTRELDAVVSEAAQSTQQILAAAEVIDQAASILASNGDNAHGLDVAANIQGGTALIYEACNFHDIVGQRVAKVLDALEGIEGGAFRDTKGHLIHGPKLNGDPGHATQDEVDAILGS